MLPPESEEVIPKHTKCKLQTQIWTQTYQAIITSTTYHHHSKIDQNIILITTHELDGASNTAIITQGQGDSLSNLDITAVDPSETPVAPSQALRDHKNHQDHIHDYCGDLDYKTQTSAHPIDHNPSFITGPLQTTSSPKKAHLETAFDIVALRSRKNNCYLRDMRSDQAK